MTPVKGSFDPEGSHDPQVENYCCRWRACMVDGYVRACELLACLTSVLQLLLRHSLLSRNGSILHWVEGEGEEENVGAGGRGACFLLRQSRRLPVAEGLFPASSFHSRRKRLARSQRSPRSCVWEATQRVHLGLKEVGMDGPALEL